MKPWEQRKDEPKDAFAAFSRYLSLGPCRRLDQVVSNAAPLYLVMQWRAKYAWEKRCQAFDRWTTSSVEPDTTPGDVAKCHDAAFLNFSQVLLLESRKWLAAAQAGDIPNMIDLKDCLKMLEYFKPSTKKMELDVKNTEGAGKPQLSDEEYATLERIFARHDDSSRTEH